MTAQESHLAVGAIVRRGTDILLVTEEAEDADGDDGPVWALPGGMVDTGSSTGAQLLRRVAEETGLTGAEPGKLLWVARYTVGGQDFEAFGFEVTADGEPTGTGAWVPLAEAVQRLSRMWFAPIREPAVAYLTGRAPAATLWSWPKLDGPPETVPPLAQ